MSKGVFYTATTLDGYLADENDSLDWLFVQDQDHQGPLNYDDFIKDIGAIAPTLSQADVRIAMEHATIPFHPGAVRYYKEVGVAR